MAVAKVPCVRITCLRSYCFFRVQEQYLAKAVKNFNSTRMFGKNFKAEETKGYGFRKSSKLSLEMYAVAKERGILHELRVEAHHFSAIERALRTVHVRCLPFGVDEEDVRGCLEEFGTILEVSLKSEGYAFVVYEDCIEAEEAVDQGRRISLFGCNVAVQISTPTKKMREMGLRSGILDMYGSPTAIFTTLLRIAKANLKARDMPGFKGAYVYLQDQQGVMYRLPLKDLHQCTTHIQMGILKLIPGIPLLQQSPANSSPTSSPTNAYSKFPCNQQGQFHGSQENQFNGSQENLFNGSQENQFSGSQENQFSGSQENSKPAIAKFNRFIRKKTNSTPKFSCKRKFNQNRWESPAIASIDLKKRGAKRGASLLCEFTNKRRRL